MRQLHAVPSGQAPVAWHQHPDPSRAVGKGLWQAEASHGGHAERGGCSQLRLADGAVDGGAEPTAWCRQEKQVVPGVWSGLRSCRPTQRRWLICGAVSYTSPFVCLLASLA